MAGNIYITGDCHADFRKFNNENFPEQRILDKNDYVIICGDFGGVWDVGWESKREKYWFDWLDSKNYTTLFIDGNHENFDRLNSYPVKEWNSGQVHVIRSSVLHLMRGNIFDIQGLKIFCMGGAASHDMDGGILDTEEKDFALRKKELNREGIPYRIKHLTWWEQELPDISEYDKASDNLEKVGFKVDYIITHCCSGKIQNKICSDDNYKQNALTDFFDIVMDNCKYRKWYFGHYHKDLTISDKEVLLYNKIIKLGDSVND